jgi:hypothetical protein
MLWEPCILEWGIMTNVMHKFLIYLFTSVLHVSGFLLSHLHRQVYNFGSGARHLGMVSAPGRWNHTQCCIRRSWMWFRFHRAASGWIRCKLKNSIQVDLVAENWCKFILQPDDTSDEVQIVVQSDTLGAEPSTRWIVRVIPPRPIDNTFYMT